MKRLLKAFTLLLATVFAIAAPLALACSSCGCTLSSDWDSHGYAASPGIRLDLRTDYLDQSQLRGSGGTVERANLTLPAQREIEQYTRNLYSTVGLDYSASGNWGLNLQLPYIERDHASVAGGDSQALTSHTAALGDVRIVGRYLGDMNEHFIGLQFGLKLPSGAFHDKFSTGPQAGTPADRGLQAGSGTTDLMLGLYHFDTLSKNWDYFAQGMLQQALDARADYRPGSSLNANAGVRYMVSETVIPQFQINAKTGRRDTGANADQINSGGTLVYLSPGLAISLTHRLNTFGFIQLPLYQRVNGYQLAPHYTLSLGLRYTM